ncbi:MAG: hypothetical protein AAFQ23_07930 [Cyanobacteria bacterium J06623_1]
MKPSVNKFRLNSLSSLISAALSWLKIEFNLFKTIAISSYLSGDRFFWLWLVWAGSIQNSR